MPLSIGLTGGIASGKSTVAVCFENLGIDVIDADQVSRDLVEPGQPALDSITEHFGVEILDHDGRLNRRLLRELVFNNPHKRAELERIMHPAIRNEVKLRQQNCQSVYCLLMVPIMVKTGMHKMVSRLLVVDIPPQTQIERLIRRDDIDKALASKMLAAQETREERLAAADDVLFNEISPDNLPFWVGKLHAAYERLARNPDSSCPPMRFPADPD